ncbi:MAG: outer membrane beta-barrel protein [Terracidiphilus sp.]|jgi:hypothetical protein
MIRLYDFQAQRRQKTGFELRLSIFLALLLLLLSFRNPVSAQVVPAGYQGVTRLSAGVLGSGDTFQYGSRKMLGVGVFVDAETTSHFGIEAEGRWVELHQTANVHAETYSIGGRYHFVRGRFQPYVKGLIGFANFNFPYNYAQGRYTVVTVGGGVDFHWKHRIIFRGDLEYQDWPQFTYGSMTSLNASVGLKVRIF